MSREGAMGGACVLPAPSQQVQGSGLRPTGTCWLPPPSRQKTAQGEEGRGVTGRRPDARVLHCSTWACPATRPGGSGALAVPGGEGRGAVGRQLCSPRRSPGRASETPARKRAAGPASAGPDDVRATLTFRVRTAGPPLPRGKNADGARGNGYRSRANV